MHVTGEDVVPSLLQEIPEEMRGEGRFCTDAGDLLGTGTSVGHSSGQRAETGVDVMGEP